MENQVNSLEKEMDMLNLAVKVTAGVPLTQQEKRDYIQHKAKVLANEARAEYKEITGKDLQV